VSATSVGQRVRPFWGRVAIMESPVDQEQRPSGLIVPLKHEEIEETCRRGVVLHIDQRYHELDGWGVYAQQIDAGTVVYFTKGVRVGDTWIVDISDVLAYEDGEGS
jgi:co-chaperonin GroES (HSP10)